MLGLFVRHERISVVMKHLEGEFSKTAPEIRKAIKVRRLVKETRRELEAQARRKLDEELAKARMD